MTFRETTTPSTDTEPVPQTSGDDPFGLDDIPDFLRRSRGRKVDRLSQGVALPPRLAGLLFAT